MFDKTIIDEILINTSDEIDKRTVEEIIKITLDNDKSDIEIKNAILKLLDIKL